MKNYAIAILTKRGPIESENDILTMVKVSVEDEKDILREALKSQYMYNLISDGHRYCQHVYCEI